MARSARDMPARLARRIGRAALGLLLAAGAAGAGASDEAAPPPLSREVGELELSRDPFSTPAPARSRFLLEAVEEFEARRDGEVVEVNWRATEDGSLEEEFVWLEDAGGDSVLWVGERTLDRRSGDWLAGIELSESDAEDRRTELVVYTVRPSGDLERPGARRLVANRLDLGAVADVGRPIASLVEGEDAWLLLRTRDGRLREAVIPTLSSLDRLGVPRPPTVRATTPEAWRSRTRLPED